MTERFTSTDVFNCRSCLIVANSATATKMQEILGIDDPALLKHVHAIHFQQKHDERNSLLLKLEGER